MGFVHLHTRTQYSILDGAWGPEDVVKAAAARQMSAVAVTDNCNLYGAVEFYKAAKSAGVQPVFGASLWTWPDGLGALASRPPDGGWEVVLLIEGGDQAQISDPFVGYRNLCELVTRAIFDGIHYRPRVDLELLARHSEGLICLTSGLHGPVGRHLRRPEEAERALQRLAELFGPQHLYVELQDYGLERQPECNQLSRELAARLGLSTVITNDVRYEQPTDAVTLDLLNCVSRSEPVDGADRRPLPTDQQYFKSEAEMREVFPDEEEALQRTGEIAKRCKFKFKTDTYYFPATAPPNPSPPLAELKSGTPDVDTEANWAYFFQAFPPPRDYGYDSTGQIVPPKPLGAGSINGYFEWYAREGLKLRLRHIEEGSHQSYHERLEFELKIIEQMGFPAYLLIVAEFINWAKDQSIPVGPGRGSAAGSAVAWAMRITDIDPIRFSLLFERFLNPERVSMPDIDVDFCQDRREEVIEHVRRKYGRDLVSQIITYGKLQAKAALKDVARILGIDFQAADRIAKLVPAELNITLEKALQEEKLKALAEGDPLVARILCLAQRVEGMCRQTGVHAAGVVIADRPLVQLAPLFRMPGEGEAGGQVVQYDMKSAESVGLIKFDFLGLKTLDQIRDALKMVKRNTGEEIDLELLPYDDAATYQLLQKGDALGVFQVESSGMRELLTRLKPTNIDDLIALLALYRPGPLSSGMVDSFIDCKHGRKAIEYPHPVLQPILESTYGSIVYQEQVMQVAQVLSGYSLGEADLLRRAMGKKKAEEMAKQKSRFVDGAVGRGHDAKKADEIFELLVFFAGYGFNKSHSAAYGVVSYHTAYLKAHHRAEYMAALMSIDAGNTDKILLYIGDCKRAGIEVLPPDVNESEKGFDVKPGQRRKIRFGLSAIKGVGEGAVDAILEARASAQGRFQSFMDCIERLDGKRVNRKVLENLIKCGAFDWTRNARHALYEGLEAALGAAQKAIEQKNTGQTSLFGRMAAPPPSFRLPEVGEWPTAQKLAREREALGFFITGHPVEAYRALLPRLATTPTDGLDRLKADTEVRVAGMVSALRQIKTKRGDKMAFVTLEDVNGSVECVFFSEPWARSQRALSEDQPVLVTGKLEAATADNPPKIMGENAELLSEIRERRTRIVDLALEADDLADERNLGELMKLLGASKGTVPLRVHLRLPDRAWVSLPTAEGLTVLPDENLLQGLETLFRRPDVVRLG